MFSYNSKHGWCTHCCVGTGLTLTREQRKAYDDSVRGDDNKGREQSFPAEEAEVEGVVDASPAPIAAVRASTAPQRARGHASRASAIHRHRRDSRCARLASGLDRRAGAWHGRDADIARDVLSRNPQPAGVSRADVGLGYLTLDRAAPTLSGGEAQRIRLAAQLGSNLQGVCYVLDEPTIGLHPRDNGVLLSCAGTSWATSRQHPGRRGTRRGHHPPRRAPDRHRPRCRQARRHASWREGTRGRRSRANADSHDRSASWRSPWCHPLQPRRRGGHATWPALQPAPRGRRCTTCSSMDVCACPCSAWWPVTGVSGSGKSTLARDVLLANVQALPWRSRAAKAQGATPSRQSEAPAGLPPLARLHRPERL
jgi:excinuclease ABC subunit A